MEAPGATSTLAAAITPVTAPVAPTAQLAIPVTGVVGFLNAVVTNLLKPFLAPAPDSPEPLTPAVWAVLAWVRRNLFNQSPTINYNPTTTVQTGQTVTGKIGATDAEGDPLTYKVTQAPQHGTLTIDQATGSFTYTPSDINYDAAQTDSFTVSVTDGKFNLLGLFTPHGDQETIGVTVLNPTVERVILNLPNNISNPNRPRFSADGQSLYFSAQPIVGGRQEVYQIGIDGTDLRCVTCGVSTSITGDLQKPLPFEDGSGRVLIRITTGPDKYTYVIFEDGVAGKQLVPLTTPDSPTFVVDRQREVKVSPDGTHLLFSRLELGTNGYVAIVPVVGTLVRTANGYIIDDARVVAPYGEGKSWTPDGKSAIIQGGQYDAGNVDAIKVDLATGNITRVTAGLDYEENVFESPNGKWIVAGSTRGLDALTPMSRIVRPAFLPAYIVGPVYLAYASPVNVSNQAWVVAIDDELKRENGLPLIVEGDGYAGQSMPGWSPTGNAVAFWEQSKDDPTDTRLVIANLKYTTSVGGVEGDKSTPQLSSTMPKLSTYVPSAPALPPTGTYAGAGGGTATVTETPDPTQAGHTIRTVVYSDYVNEDGMVLNGTESTNITANQLSIHYTANITVTGTHTGYLRGDATVVNRQTLNGYITSELDGDVQSILDPADVAAAQSGV
ncbi:VCBS repeat-containing protein [Mycobacterium sp. OAS707]|uniref:Ig-like domain-containing protein n=1 Tax=Mycobacterium sp. OAS707 TaxID=2663822 RepID=UPI0019F03C65|nr:VCBS repeat-containing protein [Mycobacterium sp. OAS707]